LNKFKRFLDRSSQNLTKIVKDFTGTITKTKRKFSEKVWNEICQAILKLMVSRFIPPVHTDIIKMKNQELNWGNIKLKMTHFGQSYLFIYFSDPKNFSFSKEISK